MSSVPAWAISAHKSAPSYAKPYYYTVRIGGSLVRISQSTPEPIALDLALPKI